MGGILTEEDMEAPSTQSLQGLHQSLTSEGRGVYDSHAFSAYGVEALDAQWNLSANKAGDIRKGAYLWVSEVDENFVPKRDSSARGGCYNTETGERCHPTSGDVLTEEDFAKYSDQFNAGVDEATLLELIDALNAQEVNVKAQTKRLIEAQRSWQAQNAVDYRAGVERRVQENIAWNTANPTDRRKSGPDPSDPGNLHNRIF